MDNNNGIMKNYLIHSTLMGTAKLWSELSHSKRTKVGAVISRDGRILSTGFNGTAPGDHNCCEDEEGNTLESVIHAEENAILFCAKNGIPTMGSSIYTLYSPCARCARMIISCGISQVFYEHAYRDPAGIKLLERLGVPVRTVEEIRPWS
jgi:dCMP deaminase